MKSDDGSEGARHQARAQPVRLGQLARSLRRLSSAGEPDRRRRILLLDRALDPDGDWDNDGVASIQLTKDPFAKRDVRRGLDDFL